MVGSSGTRLGCSQSEAVTAGTRRHVRGEVGPGSARGRGRPERRQRHRTRAGSSAVHRPAEPTLPLIKDVMIDSQGPGFGLTRPAITTFMNDQQGGPERSVTSFVMHSQAMLFNSRGPLPVKLLIELLEDALPVLGEAEASLDAAWMRWRDALPASTRRPTSAPVRSIHSGRKHQPSGRSPLGGSGRYSD